MSQPNLPSLSVVSVAMNRAEHLYQSVEALSACEQHSEHIIVDWSSDFAIDAKQLPNDPRIKLFRVNHEQHWCLARAYNFAIAQCHAEVILKLDADMLLSPAFFEHVRWSTDYFLANDYNAGDDFQRSITGLFFIPRTAFSQIGGFNEYLYGWGYDDVDLFARLRGVLPQQPLNTEGAMAIEHGDELRSMEYQHDSSQAAIQKQLNHERNRWLSTTIIWNATIKPSCYRQSDDGWHASYVPQLPAYLVEKSQQRLQCLQLSQLTHVKLEPRSAATITALYASLNSAAGRKRLQIISYLPRIYARLVNRMLGL